MAKSLDIHDIIRQRVYPKFMEENTLANDNIFLLTKEYNTHIKLYIF